MSEPTLIEAVERGDYQKTEELIRSGADVNQSDEQGWTALNFAAGKGNLPIVKLLVENSADILKTGRDRRTPRMIALAAGRVSVVKYLKEIEDQDPGKRTALPEREYCKAYHLGNLRKFAQWSERREDSPKKDEGSGADPPFTDDTIVFIHHDFTVTETMWRDQKIVFDRVDEDWKEFCANILRFKVPDDLDLLTANE
jgi:uncharacterized protein